ncbi:MAG: hypothetical protein HDS02_04290 [Bacteroides sp.]|nr:hypothetical protein [Bacteroides sp.]
MEQLLSALAVNEQVEIFDAVKSCANGTRILSKSRSEVLEQNLCRQYSFAFAYNGVVIELIVCARHVGQKQKS